MAVHGIVRGAQSTMSRRSSYAGPSATSAHPSAALSAPLSAVLTPEARAAALAARQDSPARNGAERLARLAANARAGQWSADDDIDWRRGPRLPLWITRDQARVAISQLHYGEVSTRRVCLALLRDVPAGSARRCLEYQIEDELRHADVFKRYSARLGGLAPMDRTLGSALDAASAGPIGPLGPMVAYHVVVEGEVLRIQDSLARLLPCPLLRQICRLVARDEARHVAFGRIYLSGALADVPADARRRLYDWTYGLWRQTTSAALADRTRGSAGRGALRSWLGGAWCHHQAALQQIGLSPGPEETRAP